MENKRNILQSFFNYSKNERKSLLVLLFFVFLLQLAYFFIDYDLNRKDILDEKKWMANQTIIDSLKMGKANYKPKIYPFNPNFITDFKGYKLGMSTAEIDRLLTFRKQNTYVNSAEEFQSVTKVSDSLLQTMSPYFKFPDWVKNKKSNFKVFPKRDFTKKAIITVLDINQATKDDLIKVYGIGEGLSTRILKQKEMLSGFVSMEQLEEIWGLSPEVIENLNKSFAILSPPKVKKININTASILELSMFYNFKRTLAKEIVIYRSMNGDIKIEDLAKIKGFPVDKIKIIALYLEF